MKTSRCLLVMMLLTVPGLASASSEAGTEQQGETKTVEKKICRTDRATGSRTRVNRVCMTQAEWDRMQVALKNGINDISRDAGRSGSAPQ